MKIHRIAALFLSLVLAFSLAACGQGASSASSASSSAASSAAAESKTEEQLLAEENEILSANDALWEKVFSSMDKNVTETTISANYGDFLLSAVEKAKDQFSVRGVQDPDRRCRKDSCHRGADRRSCPRRGCRFQCRRTGHRLPQV